MIHVASIVEGHGESNAVPILIRRIAATLDPGFVSKVDPVLRVPAARLKRANEIERVIELAARKKYVQGGILVLLDCDDGCPGQIAPDLLKRAVITRSDIPISVVLAKREFEAWFLAAAESLRGERGLPHDVSSPDKPEQIRDAKGWLTNHLPSGQSYTETLDQPVLTALFDLNAARRADSFDKCFGEITNLLNQLRLKT